MRDRSPCTKRLTYKLSSLWYKLLVVLVVSDEAIHVLAHATPHRISIHCPIFRELYALRTPQNTWSRGSFVRPANCCANFTSKVAVSVPLPDLNPCKVSRRITLHFSPQFTTDAHTFQTTSTRTIYRYPPLPFGRRSIVAHVNFSGTNPSLNVL